MPAAVLQCQILEVSQRLVVLKVLLVVVLVSAPHEESHSENSADREEP